jgi:hypothetical protein
MPLVVHPRVRKGVARLATMTALGFFASTGLAAAACPTQPVAQALSQFGDSNNYFLASGGAFEDAALPTGSTATNASLVPGNEPFYVHGAGDNQSLLIASGGSVTLPYACIDSTITSFRFFAKQASPGSGLKVDLLVKLPYSWAPMTLPVTVLPDGSLPSWALTNSLTAAGSLAPGSTAQAAVRFSVPQGTGSWQIDDVYVDPYRVA